MSAGLTEIGALAKGVSAFEAGNARSKLFNANADIATEQMQSEVAAGNYGYGMVKLRGAAIEGQQVAQIGANNLRQGGTNANVVADSAMFNEMDALTTRNNAMRRAWGFEVQAVSDRTQAGMSESAGINEAFGSVLSGSAKAYDQYKKTGSWF